MSRCSRSGGFAIRQRPGRAADGAGTGRLSRVADEHALARDVEQHVAIQGQ